MKSDSNVHELYYEHLHHHAGDSSGGRVNQSMETLEVTTDILMEDGTSNAASGMVRAIPA